MKQHLISRRLWVWPLAALLLVAAVFVGLSLGDSTPVAAQDEYPALGPLPPMPQPAST